MKLDHAADAGPAHFAAWLHSDRFSCLGARAAEQRGVLRCVELGELGAAGTTAELHRALVGFVRGNGSPAEDFASFVALFDGPPDTGELDFERLLWHQLARLHELDRERYDWAPGVARDPQDPRFAFSVAGHPFFVVGMHPGASRISRRYPRPALAFNSHEQFQRLRAEGKYGRLQRRIRAREMRLQHSLKPNLGEHGQESDAVQYSGRAVGPDWACPVGDTFRAGAPAGAQPAERR